MRTHTREDPEINQIWTQSQAKQGDWPEETQKKCPRINSDSNYHEGATVSLSLHVCLSTRTIFPPNKHFTCFTTFHLFVGIYFYKADGPGPCLWPLALVVWPGNQNPASSHCRSRLPKIRTALVFQEVEKGKWPHFWRMVSWD